jgi:hypothetical protein
LDIINGLNVWRGALKNDCLALGNEELKLLFIFIFARLFLLLSFGMVVFFILIWLSVLGSFGFRPFFSILLILDAFKGVWIATTNCQRFVWIWIRIQDYGNTV